MLELSPMLIIPDVHVPYHDARAWDLMVKAARYMKPEHIIVLGDFADFYAVSSFTKDPRRASALDEEVAVVNDYLDELDDLGAKRKVFIAGNHEDRLERYLKDRAPELYNVVNVPKLFKLKQRGWEYVPYKSDIRIGKAYFTHDCGSVTGRSSIFKVLDIYQHTSITGHTHRMAYVVEGNATGEALLSAQFGWLGDLLQIDYMHTIKAKKDWALGFGFGYLRASTGHVYLQPVPIVGYTCVLGGKLFSQPEKTERKEL